MQDTLNSSWQPVIGLEIHVQLNTKTKLFSRAPNRFGDEPNTNISVICTGQPGALPMLNEEAVRKAVQFGLATRAQINQFSRFDRKCYFYPDSPRNFQITQYEKPILTGGQIQTEVLGETKTFFIDRAHLEDDAGMLKHFSQFAGVDYNRAGAPLIEIVSKPCLHSAKEAAAYAMAIRSILLYLGASDCNMEEGSLRMDVNVSVRKFGEQDLRPKVEIKNMNSFSFLEMAIESEIKRQIQLYTHSPDIPFTELVFAGTYRWDPERKQTVLMRRKERAEDYRYFPEPDIAPIVLSQEYIDEIQSQLPELPRERYRRYLSDLGLSPYSASLLIQEKNLSDYFEQTLKIYLNARALCNWITVEFLGRLKNRGISLTPDFLPPSHVAKLVQLIDENKITGRIAKNIADEMVKNPQVSPEKILQANPDYQPMSNAEDIEPIVKEVLCNNPQSVADYRAGREKAFAYLVGQVMKQTRGKASPQLVNELLSKNINPV